MSNRTPFYLRQRASSSSESFIVGGVPADIADFPHHLALLQQGRYICGASIISRLFSLSAAHCLDSGAPPSIVINSKQSNHPVTHSIHSNSD